MYQEQGQGFTLFELLVVMVIILVIAVVMIPNLLDVRNKANDTQAQSCLKQVSSLQNFIFIDNKQYSTDIASEARFPSSCKDGINFVVVASDPDFYEYTASHLGSGNVFSITSESGVQRIP